jgi:hypothetical protein
VDTPLKFDHSISVSRGIALAMVAVGICCIIGWLYMGRRQYALALMGIGASIQGAGQYVAWGHPRSVAAKHAWRAVAWLGLAIYASAIIVSWRNL